VPIRGGIYTLPKVWKGVGVVTMMIIDRGEIIIVGVLHGGRDFRTTMLATVCERVASLFLVSIPTIVGVVKR